MCISRTTLVVRAQSLALLLLALGAPSLCSASSITLGTDNGGNAFPFAGPFTGASGMEYQEAYASSDFSGPISITGIDFFQQAIGSGGDLYAATYQLSLSVVTTDIDDLSDTNFASNLGADNTVFTTVALVGAAPDTLTFNGAPFYYDPSMGNLLLDIQISDGNGSQTNSFFEDGDGSGPAGIIRYTNLGLPKLCQSTTRRHYRVRPGDRV
jgi:hypothetical protein